MSIEETAYSTLSGAAGVTALVSTRIYPPPAPESAALPYIMYDTISTEHLHTLPGVGNMARTTIQFDCNATTHAGAQALAEAVIAALEGNGYLQSRYNLYDDTVQVHSVFVAWSFLA